MSYLQVGDTLVLKCNFVIGKDQLYSVKWYKDNMEFYRWDIWYLILSSLLRTSSNLRYIPKDNPQAQEFGVTGITVSLDNSDDKTVEIPNISLTTAGTYMCEVRKS